MTSLLLHPESSHDWQQYDKLVAEAFLAFEQDAMYAVQVVESARSLSKKKKATSARKSKT